MADLTAFAFAIRAPDGERWQYISTAASLGNLMRTSSPFSARTWTTVAEAELWLDELPASAKQQIAGREVYVVPLMVMICPPRQTITLTEVIADEAPADPKAKPPSPR